jgi:PAS domain S-box-containing protein
MIMGSIQNKGWHILYVEDDEEDYFLTKEMLIQAKRQKIILEWASTLNEGREKLSKNVYDAILVDYDLGVENGIDLIREHSKKSPAPFILFTGRGSYDIDVEAMQAGATMYLSKSEANPLLLERIIRYAIERKQADEQLAYQASLLDNIHDAIIANDANQHITAWNKAAEVMYGYTAQEALGKIHGELLRSEFSGEQRASVLAQLEEIGQYTVEVSQYTKDGRLLVVEGSTIPRRDSQGKIVGYVTANRDITERKQIEQAFHENQKHIQEILESITDGFLEIDRNWCFTYANRRAANNVGYDQPGDMIGKNIWETFPALLGTDQETLYRQVMDQRQPAQAETHGSLTDRWYDYRIYPSPIGITIYWSDITERNRAEEALRKSEEKFAKSFRSSPVAIAISSVAEGRFIEVNDRYTALYGFSRDELIGHTSIELGMFPDPEDRKEIAGRFRAGNGFSNYELRLRTKSGEPKDVLFSTEPIDIDGQECMLSLVVDITERKQAEQALRESEERLRDSLENTHDSFFSLDRDWRFNYVNRHYAEILGIRAIELLGKNFWEVFPRYTGSPVEQHYRKAMEENVPVHFQSGGVYSSSWYEINIYPSQEGISVFSIDRTEEHRAEDALRESETHLRARTRELEAILDAVPAFMWITHDPQAREMTGNQPVLELLRVGHEENLSLTGPEPDKMRRFKSLQDGQEISNEQLPVQRVAASGLPLRGYELELVFEDGEIRYLFGNVSPLLDENGRPAGAVSAFIDITARILFQRRLQESENRFRVALASAPITVYTTDRDQRITWMYDRQPDFRLDQVTGLRLDQILADEPGKLLVAVQQSVIDTGQAWQGEIKIAADGKQAYFTYYIDPIRGENGKITGLACAGYDITEREQAEDELKRSLERERVRAAEIETLMDTVPAMIWISHDPQCREMTGNRYGYEFLKMWQGANISKTASEEDMNQQPYHNFKDGREIPTEELPMQVAAATGKPANNYDFDLVFNDGSVRTVLGNVNPLFDQNRKPSGAVAVFMDITDRRREREQLKHYAEELERSNQALRDFSFFASHDLQEPLRKVQGFGHLLETRFSQELGAQGQDYIARMISASNRMSEMLQDLLAYSRVTTQREPFVEIDLGAVAQEVLSDLEVRIMNTGAKVELSELPSLHADRMQMRQLLQNLIGNALKYHREGVAPVVRVTSRIIEKSKVEIMVNDNGIGFDMKDAGKIFEPFIRLHSKWDYEGTGMGLAICKKIIERHNGTIYVSSLPGQGSTFTITLPLG